MRDQTPGRVDTIEEQVTRWVDSSHYWVQTNGVGSHKCKWCDAFYHEGYQVNMNLCLGNPAVLRLLKRKGKDY